MKNLTAPGHYPAGGDAPGLLFQVTKTGAKSWVVRLSVGKRIATENSKRAGQLVQHRRDYGLGSYPKVSLKEARIGARKARADLSAGKDPHADKTASRSQALARSGGKTFKTASVEYIDSMRSGWKGPKSAEQWTNSLATYANP
ncbi:MAG TPA: Arm DNA-binding domain-containing protein, partial [Burkholderiaceae bacterium]